jgi:hypothetical protein
MPVPTYQRCSLAALSLFGAYLLSPCLLVQRVSVPVAFSALLFLCVAPLHPTVLVSSLSVLSSTTAAVLFALDHIVSHSTAASR